MRQCNPANGNGTNAIRDGIGADVQLSVKPDVVTQKNKNIVRPYYENVIRGFVDGDLIVVESEKVISITRRREAAHSSLVPEFQPETLFIQTEQLWLSEHFIRISDDYWLVGIDGEPVSKIKIGLHYTAKKMPLIHNHRIHIVSPLYRKMIDEYITIWEPEPQ